MKILMLALLLPVMLMACKEEQRTASPDASRNLVIVTQKNQQHHFSAELALTPAQQQKGLMNRTEMADDAGMLFFFGDEAPRSFWMKNTLIPLDIIFIRRDGAIHKIHDSAIPHDLTSIKSDGPVAAALEINGGLSKELGLSAGDKIHHLLFNNAL